jgi:hypothetical protein
MTVVTSNDGVVLIYQHPDRGAVSVSSLTRDELVVLVHRLHQERLATARQHARDLQMLVELGRTWRRPWWQRLFGSPFPKEDRHADP